MEKKLQFKLKNYFIKQKTTLVILAKQIATKISAAPGWITSRPLAFREWKKLDKKKKKYRSFRLQKRIKPEPRYMPSAGTLLKATFKFLWNNKKLFLLIFVIHSLIYIVAVRRSQAMDVATIQSTIKGAIEGTDTATKLTTTATTLGAVVGLSGASQVNAGSSAVLILFMSLIYIWAIRQIHASIKIKMRDAYYQGPAPIMSVLVILFVLSLQLIPFAIASFVYGTARSGGLFATGFEDLSFFIITALCALFSLYLITSTIIGIYIVTLPGTYPLTALRAAKKLVQFQRFKVFQRMIALTIFMGIIYVFILLIAIRLIPEYTFILAEALQLVAVPFVHVYLYKLYRSLI